MTILKRLAIRAARELACRPEVRARAKDALTNATRVFNEEVKPRTKEAWRDAQPSIEHAKAALKRFTQKLQDEYRKGRAGE